MRDKAESLLEVPGDALQEERTFADLGADSLAFVEYVMDLEDALGIELPEDEVTATGDVGALLDLVMVKLGTALNRDG